MRSPSAWLIALVWALSVMLGGSLCCAQTAGANAAPTIAIDPPSQPEAPDTPETPQASPQAGSPSRDSLYDYARRQVEPAQAPRAPARPEAEPAAPRPGAHADAYDNLPITSQGQGPAEQDDAGFSSDSGSAANLSDGGYILNTLAALGLVIALILLLRWGWLKVSGQRQVGDTPVVEVLSRTAVAPKNHVVLLRIGERILVVGDSSAGGLRTLSEIADPEEVADLLGAIAATRDNSISKNFTQLLGRFGRDYDELGRSPDLEGSDDQEHLFDRTRESVSGLLSRVRTLSGKGGA